MNKIKSHEDLIIWRKGIDLAAITYKLTSTFPKNELFGLVSQMNRSGISIPSNIAEGFGRKSIDEFKRFLRISLGSLYEYKTQLHICRKLGYLSENEYVIVKDLCIEIDKMINTILKKY
jgi:four helix bundle protein